MASMPEPRQAARGGRAQAGAGAQTQEGAWAQTWSPTWHFTDDTYNRAAASFENPYFVDCVVHSYRHRIGNAAGEPRFLDVEKQLAKRPAIQVPAIVLRGADDTLGGREPAEAADRATFPKLVSRKLVAGAGHFLPRENPGAVSTALLEVLAASK